MSFCVDGKVPRAAFAYAVMRHRLTFKAIDDK